MHIQQFKKEFFESLNSLYPITEIQSFFNILIEHQLHLSRIDVALKPDYNIENSVLEFLQNALCNLKKHIPIQHIIGETEFFGLTFKVDSNVLIPRPETEELVSWILNNSKIPTSNSKLSILDIGTGSGCIAISLAKNLPNAEVYALDISAEALKIAKENAKTNNVKIHFMGADILNLKELPYKFDIIVSNPPYVRELEKDQMQENVLEHEPHLALFVKDNDPLLFYDKIADFSKTNLLKNGQLYFEINQYLGNETVELLSKKDFQNIALKKDIYGVDRIIKSNI